jgi:hypothetical protein
MAAPGFADLIVVVFFKRARAYCFRLFGTPGWVAFGPG